MAFVVVLVRFPADCGSHTSVTFFPSTRDAGAGVDDVLDIGLYRRVQGGARRVSPGVSPKLRNI
jgi:hypothetical protein